MVITNSRHSDEIKKTKDNAKRGRERAQKREHSFSVHSIDCTHAFVLETESRLLEPAFFFVGNLYPKNLLGAVNSILLCWESIPKNSISGVTNSVLGFIIPYPFQKTIGQILQS